MIKWMIFLISLYGSIAKGDEMTSDEKKEELRKKMNPFLLLRDPFRAPPVLTVSSSNEMVLQKYGLNELKLLGVITGLKSKKAMIMTPDKKSYFLEENGKIGKNRGVLLKILPEKIVVQEEVLNIIGEWEIVRRELALSEATQSVFSVAKIANEKKKEDSEIKNGVEKNEF